MHITETQHKTYFEVKTLFNQGWLTSDQWHAYRIGWSLTSGAYENTSDEVLRMPVLPVHEEYLAHLGYAVTLDANGFPTAVHSRRPEKEVDVDAVQFEFVCNEDGVSLLLDMNWVVAHGEPICDVCRVGLTLRPMATVIGE